ncbi:MAG: recombination protein RecR [Kiritimatiellae bacterium]|nr:recombination protein RecR [Kiritimatiellia bacterium]
MIPPVDELEKCLSKLPGLGRRSALRAALALVREKERLLSPLVASLIAARDGVKTCSVCGSFTVSSSDPCALCTDPLRDATSLCVVEEPSDVVSIESSGAFRGRYHVLGGKLSPAHRSGPEKLAFRSLRDRVLADGVKEVLIAVSTDMDGDATAGYIVETLQDTPARVTRLAFGLPAGSAVAYSDPLTLRRAVRGRTEA